MRKETTAGEIMTRDVVTVSPDASLAQAAEILGQPEISGAPVVEESSGQLVGIISEADLLSEARRVAAIPRGAAFGVFIAPEETLLRAFHEGRDLPVSRIMTKKVITVQADTPAAEIARLMQRHHVNRIPVVDDDKKLIGIVTRHDLLHNLFHPEKEAGN